jgi:hypothetical protein
MITPGLVPADLSITQNYDASLGTGTWANAAHAAIVEVGDCGVMINPLIVDGQVEGGSVQGIWGAMAVLARASLIPPSKVNSCYGYRRHLVLQVVPSPSERVHSALTHCSRIREARISLRRMDWRVHSTFFLSHQWPQLTSIFGFDGRRNIRLECRHYLFGEQSNRADYLLMRQVAVELGHIHNVGDIKVVEHLTQPVHHLRRGA